MQHFQSPRYLKNNKLFMTPKCETGKKAKKVISCNKL